MNYDENAALLSSSIPELGEPKRGKVRDIYDLGDSLLLIATDRISAFDVVMPNGIPDKGKVLTSISKYWFDSIDWLPNHLITMNTDEYPDVLKPYAADLDQRSMLVKKCEPLPIECVARGFLIGSGWKDYQKTGAVCGISLRDGYQIASRLDEVLYTPASKADVGDHDENISFEQTVEIVGQEAADKCKEMTLRLFIEAAEVALEKGIIIADTKFEFGYYEGEIILIDEVLTCDSSRFWPASSYEEGKNPPSLDKQFVRDYLETQDWDKTAPGPVLPDEIVQKTREIYREAYKQLTGEDL
ncbi:MAG: phosphoribosylaminoimidazolesuccinocarboxamide synthase [Lentisphaeria bacterium]|nr:phosphoribosylaminoimidazolesuccinocarboxamide synthase [Lentisphaeria bacterium]